MKKPEQLTFAPIGGGREIGANSYLIRVNGRDILLDCGVHPKKDGVDSLPDFSLLRHAPAAVVVSHGHVDHCGALPQLLKEFPDTVPYTTRPTRSVMDRMLHNSVSVMKILARERNISGYPLYQHNDVDCAIKRISTVELGREFPIVDDGEIVARLTHAGHVLGSASILVKTGSHTLFYTGDVCAADQTLMEGLDPLEDGEEVDTLVIESTYGANVRADMIGYEAETARFAESVNRVLARGGVALVPSFALGRTQEMLNIVARLQDAGTLPDVPVYASGLGRAIYEVYNKFQEYLHTDADLQPLSRFGRIGDVWNRNVVRELMGPPAVIVATSGMMIEDTPSAMLAEGIVREPRHGIFFVGYLDPDTLGYKLLHSAQGARLSFARGRPPTKIVLDDIGWFHFGSHASREGLHAMIERIRPKNVIFVHGDPEAIDWMCERTGDDYRPFTVSAGQSVTVEA